MIEFSLVTQIAPGFKEYIITIISFVGKGHRKVRNPELTIRSVMADWVGCTHNQELLY